MGKFLRGLGKYFKPGKSSSGDEETPEGKKVIKGIFERISLSTMSGDLSISSIVKAHHALEASLGEAITSGEDGFDKESIRSMYSVLLKGGDVYGMLKNNKVYLKNQARVVARVFGAVKRGENETSLARELKTTPIEASMLLKDMKKMLRSAMFMPSFNQLTLEDLESVLDGYGVKEEYAENQMNAKKVFGILNGKVKEEMPSLYESIAPHIHRIFGDAGFSASLPAHPEKDPGYYKINYTSFLEEKVENLLRRVKTLEKEKLVPGVEEVIDDETKEARRASYHRRQV